MVVEQATAKVNDVVTDRPKTVVLVFLLLTGVFVFGLGNVETESGSQQFVEDLDSFEAFQDIQRDFGPSFGEQTATTQLLQREQNVLSKASLLRMLRAQERIANQQSLRVQGTSSPARTIVRQLDPTAETLAEQRNAVEAATTTEIQTAVRQVADQPGFTSNLHEDFNRKSATASAALGTVSHDSSVENREERVERALATVGGGVQDVGSAPDTIGSSLALVMPAAFLLIVLFLVVAYRDLVDLILGTVSILITLVWTFGFLGLADIPFNPLLVAVPPLLIAVGIDFGIHAINRYREERERGNAIGPAMQSTTDQLLVAFFIVMGTTVIGFLSNLVSALEPIQDFGYVAAIGITFTFLIFGIFLPAMKVTVDRARERYPIPTMSERPLGSEGSVLGRVLSGGVVISRTAPVLFVLVVLVTSGAAGAYATGVGTGFSADDFLPPEHDDLPQWQKELPAPFRPPEYSYVSKTNYIDDNFPQDGTVFIYVKARMERDSAVERVHRMGADPPDTFVRDGRHAEEQSIATLIRSTSARDPRLRELVSRNDRDGDGLPDDNLAEIYAHLESTPSGVGSLLSDSRRSTLVTYSVDPDATNQEVTADANEVATETPLDATPTGNAVIFEEASQLILDTVVTSLLITLVGASAFLIVVYGLIEGRPSLGLANVVPIAVTVTFVVASMRYLGVDFNAINGVILSLTIGLGIDYSVHVTHRFADEFHDTDIDTALDRAVRATGGALTGSMLTTVSGIGVLVFALNPAIGVFGVLTALSVIYAYLASVLVLPSVLVVWDRVFNRSAIARLTGADASSTSPVAVDD